MSDLETAAFWRVQEAKCSLQQGSRSRLLNQEVQSVPDSSPEVERMDSEFGLGCPWEALLGQSLVVSVDPGKARFEDCTKQGVGMANLVHGNLLWS
jgi:hypothetical protein